MFSSHKLPRCRYRVGKDLDLSRTVVSPNKHDGGMEDEIEGVYTAE